MELGFLSTNSEEIPGNAGLMDTIQALKFIKENIEHFGGDPNQITVFGQSSGAVMVSALIISPAIPENLFQRAIIQSGSIFGNWTHSSDLAKDARAIAVAAGLNPIQSTASLNQAFKKMKVSNLLKAAQRSRVQTFSKFINNLRKYLNCCNAFQNHDLFRQYICSPTS